MEVHPAAELFPLMQGAEFDALVEDIRANGLREPGKLDTEGLLLDGRNRERACEAAGVPFETVTVDLNGDDPLAYVVSLNVKRRSLTIGQRAIAAAEAYESGAGRKLRPGEKWYRVYAKTFDVGEKAVQEARALVTNAPDLAERLKAGQPLKDLYEEHQRRQGRDKTTREALAQLRVGHPDLGEQVEAETLALRDALVEAERRDAAEKQHRWAATMNALDGLAHFDRPAEPDAATHEAGLLDTEIAAQRGEQLTPDRLRRASAWAALLADALERRLQ